MKRGDTTTGRIRHRLGAGLLVMLGFAALVPLASPAGEAKRDHPPERDRQEEPPGREDREAVRPGGNASVDRIIEQVERRYEARVVRVDRSEVDGRPIYVLRLLSNKEGRVWVIRVDAETGKTL